MSSIAGSASGTLSPYTEFGPPLKMMPVGFQSRIHSTVRLGGWISEYTRASRTRRAINWVNCEPKSMMRIRLLITLCFRLLRCPYRRSPPCILRESSRKPLPDLSRASFRPFSAPEGASSHESRSRAIPRSAHSPRRYRALAGRAFPQPRSCAATRKSPYPFHAPRTRSASPDRRRCGRTLREAPFLSGETERGRTASSNHRHASPSLRLSRRTDPEARRSRELGRGCRTSRQCALLAPPHGRGFLSNQILVGLAFRYHRVFVSLDQHLRGPWTRVVVGGHDEPVGARRLNRKKIARLRVVDLPVESEKVTALANRTDDVGDGSAPGRVHSVDSVKGIVVRRTEKVGHTGVGDDELLAAAAFSIENARQQNSGVADEESSRLEDYSEPRPADEGADHIPKVTDINRPLDVIRDGETAADVEILQPHVCIPLDLAAKVQQSLQPDFIWSELRDLRPDVHVETPQADIG